MAAALSRVVPNTGSRVRFEFAIDTLIGYQVCEFMDCLAKQRALDKIASEEFEWKTDPEDPENEINEDGSSSRIKLPHEHQIVVGRINDRLRYGRRPYNG